MRYASLLPIVALAIISPTLASVFVYYPLRITIAPTGPGVVFEAGSNANQVDIGTGKVISVTITESNTNASISIHPTYQKNYYKDVLRIYNGDDNVMRVYLIFRSFEGTFPQGMNVTLFIYQDTAFVRGIRLNVSSGGPVLNQPIYVGQISSGQRWQIDFYVYIPGTSSITPGQSYTVKVDLVYTPSTETPPITPGQGR